jgi:OOP family OmpA-OmpF porin
MARRASAAALLALVFGAALASGAQALDLPLPRGAQEVFSEVTDPGSYALPVDVFAEGALPGAVLEGRVTRQAFRIDNRSVTLLQVIAPIRAALQQAGYEIVLDCAALQCGGFDFRFATEVLPAPAMFVDLTDFRFLSATRGASAVSLLVSGTPTRRFLQVIRVGPAEPGSDPITVTSAGPAPAAAAPAAPAAIDGLDAGLEGAGRVVLDDLTFETGRTALSAGPYASLQALARYLAANPAARIALVGHTDAVGGLEGNITLSEERAAAVRARLVETYGVAEAQLTATGIGFLSPRASNLTEAGRAANRRVEAVLTTME